MEEKSWFGFCPSSYWINMSVTKFWESRRNHQRDQNMQLRTLRFVLENNDNRQNIKDHSGNTCRGEISSSSEKTKSEWVVHEFHYTLLPEVWRKVVKGCLYRQNRSWGLKSLSGEREMEEGNAEYRLESLRWLALIDETPSCGEEIIPGGGGLV